MTNTHETPDRVWTLLIALLSSILAAFLSAISTVLVIAPPWVVLAIVLTEFLFLSFLFASLLYLASTQAAKKAIRKSLANHRGTFICVAVVALVVGSSTVAYLWSQRIVSVPALLGKNLNQATVELHAVGLRPDPFVAAGSDDFAPISHQEPAANVPVMRGSVVYFIVGVLDVKIAITEPADKGIAPHAAMLRGTSKGISESKGRLQCNVLLHSFNADGYWVYGPLVVDEAGNWQCLVYLGQKSEVGRKFQLLAVVTASPLKRQGEAHGPPEYDAIPPYLAISKQVVVTRE